MAMGLKPLLPRNFIKRFSTNSSWITSSAGDVFSVLLPVTLWSDTHAQVEEDTVFIKENTPRMTFTYS